MAPTTVVAQATPLKQTGIASPARDSPGNWEHPRLQEIQWRRAKTTFDGRNVSAIAWNFTFFIGLLFARALYFALFKAWLASIIAFTGPLSKYIAWAYTAALFYPWFNILIAFLPLLRPEDDMSDIALTARQREILGLAPTTKQPTPGSVIHTPPRYSQSASPISWASGSPHSRAGSPGNTSTRNSPYSPSQPSPLLHKAVNGGINGRRSSLGSPSPLGRSSGSTLLGGSEGPSTPSPGQKRASVGLTNKWLYERGRVSPSGNNWGLRPMS